LEDDQIQAYMKDMEVNGTNKLIEDKLILSAANNLGIEVREALVDERIAEMKTKYGSEQKLVDALIKNGATLTDLRNKILDQLKIKFIIDHEVKSKIYVNPQEVTNYYEQNKEQFSQEDSINLDSIFIAYGNDKKEALRKAVEVSKAIAMKTNFNDLIIKYSQGPSVGIVKRGQLLPPVEEVVFNLKLNEISPLVGVENGIYVFKLIGEKPAKISSLEDVKSSIYDLLYKNKFKEQFLIWIEKLKSDAYIEIKP
jgi:parvulin-like peptidyl-prolyl isomerase